ncbi:HIT family protein [Bartonella tamiae]|uniref:HIT domain-containing protein n=1 Tax=Bartonella tamiae Th239 TaxID=1094558 RepID=J1K1E6_9HYPH|nr:hypothetical protein ME5_00609 [Bartonella tamiae Th239]EJF93058.1 hypothetical protein MEG_01272 [Bartonella tamiae Th307]
MKSSFVLDSRLEMESFPVVGLGLSDVRLMNDCRWPWLILVPRIAQAEEIHHLIFDDQLALLAEINEVAVALEAITGCFKVNIAALGNLVRQLHIHIIARNEDDANWPNPVWGFGERQVYKNGQDRNLVRQLQLKLDQA